MVDRVTQNDRRLSQPSVDPFSHPRDVLVRVNRKRFESADVVFKVFASSWIHHPRHLGERNVKSFAIVDRHQVRLEFMIRNVRFQTLLQNRVVDLPQWAQRLRLNRLKFGQEFCRLLAASLNRIETLVRQSILSSRVSDIRCQQRKLCQLEIPNSVQQLIDRSISGWRFRLRRRLGGDGKTILQRHDRDQEG